VAEGGGLSTSVVFPSKSNYFNNFRNRATWLLLALEGLFWQLTGTISGTAHPSCACPLMSDPLMSDIDNIRYRV